MRVRVLFFLLACCISFSAKAQWTKVSLNTTSDLMDIHFPGYGHGYIVGLNNAMYKTTDSGKSWHKITLTGQNQMVGVWFIDTTTGFTFGNNAGIQRTANGGKTWTSTLFIPGYYLHKGAFFDSAYGVAVGERGIAVRSSDTGKTWKIDTTAHKKNFNHVAISPNGTCWAVGDSGAIFTKHVSGGLWTKNKNYSTHIKLSHVQVFNDTTILVCGGMFDTIANKIVNITLFSANGGNAWEYNTVAEARQINSAFHFNKDTGYVTGSSGIIARVYERGVSSGRQTTPTVNGLNGIYFLSRSRGFCVGDGGMLLTTGNAGGYGTGISKTAAAETLRVFPNPAPVSGTVTVTASYPIIDVQVFDMTGRLLAARVSAGAENTCLLEMPDAGVYTVVITAGNGSVNQSRILVR